jgi:hypothetical protein
VATLLRTLLVSAALGCAAAFACRGDWTLAWAAVAAGIALSHVAGRVAGDWAACWAAAKTLLRESPQLAAGRRRKRLVRAYTCSRCGEPGVTTWDSKEAAARGERLSLDLVCDRCLSGAVSAWRRAAAR